MSNVQYTAPTLNDTGLSQFIKNLDAINNKMKIAGKQATSFAKQNLYMLKISAMLAGNEIEKVATKSLTVLSNRMQSSYKNIKQFGSDFKKKTKDMASATNGIKDKVINFAEESVGAAQAQVQNEMKLGSALKQRTNATKNQINSILKLTSAQQANGVVSDEVQMSGAQQLASYAKNSNSIKALIPAMNNLLVKQKGLNGTTEDAADVADLMGKGLLGQTDELKKAGIAFSESEEKVIKYGTEEERAAVLARVINKNVGDANKEMANTDVGKIKKANNLFADLKEQIGKMLLPFLGKVAESFSKIFKTIMKHQKIALIIGTFVAVLATLITIISIIAGIIETITALQLAFNITLGLCPIVWIIAIIALVIAAIVGLILYWDQLKAAAASVWESITTYFGNLKDSVVGFFTDMVTGIKERWDSIIEFLKNPAKGVIDFITNKTSKESGKDSKPKIGPKGGETKQSNRALYGNALGTSYWQGGLTYINERGGEIVDLPNGSRIIPADKSEKLLSGKGISFGNIYITAKGVTASEVVNELVPKLKLQLANI